MGTVTDLQMRSQTEKLACLDDPFGGIILVPPDSVPVVHGELVVEIVVAFTDRDKRGNEMITRSMLVIERRLAKIMSK